MRELVAALESGLSDHPSLEELRDFAVGNLPEEQRDRIEEHLSLCGTCARKAVALAGPPEEVRRGDLLTEGELDAEWKRFRTTLEEPRRRRAMAIPALIAAMLVLALAGWFGWHFWPSPAREQIARLNPLLEDVRSFGPLEPIVPAAGAEILVLNLDLDTQNPLPAYDVEINLWDGPQVWSQQGVPSTASTVQIKVPLSKLSPGDYKIRLRSPQRTLEERFGFSIKPSPDS